MPTYYKHYKGNIYEFICTAMHEKTYESLVVYRSIDGGEFWTRSAEEFYGIVELEAEASNPGPNAVARFQFYGHQLPPPPP